MASRIEYQKEMDALHQQMIRMGTMVEDAIHLAVASLIDMDREVAQKVIEGDDRIDEMERDINTDCIRLIARQQPVASDLRDIASNLKLITDLERIGDHAEDIAERIIYMINNDYRVTIPHDLIKLTDLMKNILRGALNAYVSRDRDLTMRVVSMDDQIDEVYDKLKAYLIRQMRLDSENTPAYVELLMICKHLERAADHSQNVAEWVMYYLDGSLDFDFK